MLENLKKIESTGLSWTVRTSKNRSYFIHVIDKREHWTSVFQAYGQNPETLVDQALSASMMYLATPKAKLN